MNIVPQLETDVDAVVVASNMTAEEARECIAEIKGHLNNIRLLLLELDERRGWEALGYSSIRQCMVGEFGRSQSQLYRELKAGKIEREISPRGEIGLIPEKHLRHIGKLPPERWSSAWAEALQTALPKGVTTTHVEKTVARIKSELTHAQKAEPAANQNVPTAEQDFVLGEWVEVLTRNGNATWDGLRGPVTRVDQYEITVQLDEGKWKHLRFYRHELVKVPAPNDELNRMIQGASREALDSASLKSEFQSFYKRDDLVLIDCPASAEKEYKQWNGCWGKVKSVGRSGSLEVMIGGNTVRFKASDLDMIDNPMPILKEIAEHLNQLLSRADLDELDRQTLTFYHRRLNFTDRQLQVLTGLWNHYTDPD